MGRVFHEVTNVLHVQLLDEVVVFLTREQLCEAVSRHLSSRLPLDSDSSSVYLLAKPHLMDIDVVKLCLDAIDLALSETYSLRFVTPESLLGMKRKADVQTNHTSSRIRLSDTCLLPSL
jgi:hypothetical protein